MAIITLALEFLGDLSMATTVLFTVWGLFATSAPVAWWTWLSRSLPHNAEAGGALMVAVIQLAIMMGAVIGGLLYDSIGYQATFGMSASLLIASALLTVITARAQKQMLLTHKSKERCALI